MVREVALADGEETLDGGHEFIVYPDAAHGVVYGREDLHGSLVGAFVGDFLVHVEEVAVACLNLLASEVLDGLAEVEEYGKSSVVHAVALVAALFGGTAGDVAGDEVSECGIAALEIVVAVFFGNVLTLDFALLQTLGIFELLGHPDASVVTERLGHQGEFRLLVAMNGNAGGVNLHVAGVGEEGSLAVAGDGGGAVATHGIGGEEVGVSVTAGTDNDGMGSETLNLSGHKVACDDSACTAVDDDHVEHLITGIELYGAGVHLAHQRAVCSEQELLSGLTLGIEGTAHLRTAERTVGEHAAVFACEGHTLCHTLVDNVGADLCQTVNVGLTGTVVTTLHGVVEEAVNAVAIVLIVLGSIDTSLSGDGVCTTGRVLDAEVLYLEAHFAERSGSGGSGQTGADDDDVEFTLVLGVHKLLVCLIVGPFFSNGTFRYAGIESCHFLCFVFAYIRL